MSPFGLWSRTRPLKCAIQRLIHDPLAMNLLDGEIAPGDSLTVDADMKKGTMTFERAKAKAAQVLLWA